MHIIIITLFIFAVSTYIPFVLITNLTVSTVVLICIIAGWTIFLNLAIQFFDTKLTKIQGNKSISTYDRRKYYNVIYYSLRVIKSFVFLAAFIASIISSVIYVIKNYDAGVTYTLIINLVAIMIAADRMIDTWSLRHKFDGLIE